MDCVEQILLPFSIAREWIQEPGITILGIITGAPPLLLKTLVRGTWMTAARMQISTSSPAPSATILTLRDCRACWLPTAWIPTTTPGTIVLRLLRPIQTGEEIACQLRIGASPCHRPLRRRTAIDLQIRTTLRPGRRGPQRAAGTVSPHGRSSKIDTH